MTTSLVLRTCKAGMSSKNGFVWPGVGEIATAPDWVDNTDCGNGLHGWLYGQGDHTTSDYITNKTAKWLVVEVESDTIRMLRGLAATSSASLQSLGHLCSQSCWQCLLMSP